MDLIIPLRLPLQIYSMQDHIPVRQSQKVVFSLIEKFWILLFTVETELSKNLNNSKLYTYLIFTFSSSSELLKKNAFLHTNTFREKAHDALAERVIFQYFPEP